MFVKQSGSTLNLEVVYLLDSVLNGIKGCREIEEQPNWIHVPQERRRPAVSTAVQL